MGIMADNAREARISMEALAFDIRQTALELAALLAKRYPRPLSDRAEELMKAETPEDQQKAYDRLLKEAKRAVRQTKKAYVKHSRLGKTEVGDFYNAWAKASSVYDIVKRIGRLLDNADAHDVLTFEMLLIEKGLSEVDL